MVHWGMWIPICIIVGFFLTNYGAPWLVRRISSNVRIRNIGLRSVRGLFLKIGLITCTVDRIALTIHRSAGGSRVGLDFQNVVITLHAKPKATPVSQAHKRWGTLRKHYGSGLSISNIAGAFKPAAQTAQVSFTAWATQKFVSLGRTLVRFAAVNSLVVLMRWLPALSQRFDTQVDQVRVIMEDLSGAHLVINGLTFKAHIEFLQQDEHDNDDGIAMTRDTQQTSKFLQRGTALGKRWKGSVRRVWEMATAQTRGKAELTVMVQDVAAYPSRSSPFEPLAHRGDVNQTATSISGSPSPMAATQYPQMAACLSMRGPISISMGAEFNPKKMAFRRATGKSSLRFPSVEFAPLVMSKLLKQLRSSGSAKTSHEAEASKESVGASRLSGRTVQARSKSSRRKEFTTLQVFFAVLQEIELSVSTVQANIRGVQELDSRSTRYVVLQEGLEVRLQLSSPEQALHQQWLGKSAPVTSSQLDAFILIFQSRSVRFNRYEDGGPNSETWASLGEVSFEVLFTGWPFPFFRPADAFPNDPNSNLVSVDALLDNPNVAVQAKYLRWALDQLASNPKKTSLPVSAAPLHNIPRITCRFAVTRPSLKVLQDSPNQHAFAVARTDGLRISYDSFFKDEIYTERRYAKAGSAKPENDLILHMTLSGQLDPLYFFLSDPSSETSQSNLEKSTSHLSSEISFVASPTQSSYNEIHPVAHVDSVEFGMTGTALGFFGQLSCEGASVEPRSVLLDMSLITEEIVVDLSDPLAVSSMAKLLHNLRVVSPKPKAQSKPLLDQLPCGCMLRISLPNVRFAVCGDGQSSKQTAASTRGLGLKTSGVMTYYYFNSQRHSLRIKSTMTKASMRDRLGLGADPVHAALAHSTTAGSTNGRAMLMQFVIRRTSLRCIVATENYGWLNSFSEDPAFTAGAPDDAHIAFRAPEISGDLLVRQTHDEQQRGMSGLDSQRLSVNLGKIFCRVDLNHVHCAFAAVAALKRLRPEAPAQLTALPSVSPILIDVRTEVIQLLTVLPSKSLLFARLTGIGYRVGLVESPGLSLVNACLWVPQPLSNYAGPWDELFRANSWRLSTTPEPDASRLTFSLTGRGARLRLPYKFVLSDLVTEISVMIKAIKHLSNITKYGRLTPIERPGAEEAKTIPSITLKMDCLTVEMADDPFESRLNMIWRQGFEEQAGRLQREEAFASKVTAIKAAEAGQGPVETLNSAGLREDVSPNHTVSVEEARYRLDLFNSMSWLKRCKQSREALASREEVIFSKIREPGSSRRLHASLPFEVRSQDKCVPLLRVVLGDINLMLSNPGFKEGQLASFLHDLGQVPPETSFSLLLPLTLGWAMNALRVTLRDYPLHLLDVVESPSAWTCTSTVVIAEEIGPLSTVEWRACEVSLPVGHPEVEPLLLSIPKTIMPVKSYANPDIRVGSSDATDVSWGTSYNPGLQDVLRVFDTFSTAPRDKSPPLGFWDKLRLIFHWRIRARFDNEVRLHIKGSRDPYYVLGTGAGFVLSFAGNTMVEVGQLNAQNELVQISSDKTTFAIPDLSGLKDYSVGGRQAPRRTLKVCAKLTNGVKLGFGFAFERACGVDCKSCGSAAPFFRQCRLFDFLPHYKVALRVPTIDQPIEDSYAGFRSDFIHFSLSLTSPTNANGLHKAAPQGYNIIHFTPKVFAHFYAWYSLFGSALHLPIRQGSYYPDARPASPKFGRHIATIKYRITLSPLFIAHMYKQDRLEQWRDGESDFVGVKAVVQTFSADLHQREQEVVTYDSATRIRKTSTHKPFCAAQVILTGLELKAVYALFTDPGRALVPIAEPKRDNLPSPYSFSPAKTEKLTSAWVDFDDFNEIDWTPTDTAPRIWMFRAASCPRFTYLRTIPSQHDMSNERTEGVERSKFGDEDTHVCLLSQKESIASVQIGLARERLRQLEDELMHSSQNLVDPIHLDHVKQGIERLTSHLEAEQTLHTAELSLNDPVSPMAHGRHPIRQGSTAEERPSFDNVYEVHSPQIIMSNSIRNVLLSYYYSSNNRRAFEYHMTSRAIKFLEEQLLKATQIPNDTVRPNNNLHAAAAKANTAITAIRRMLTSESPHDGRPEPDQQPKGPSAAVDRTAEQKSHLCILLKPQIALHSEGAEEAVIYIAAMEASLRSFTVLDLDHIEDPINGYIMRRQRVHLHGVQAFVPTTVMQISEHVGVPLEIMLDFRCESRAYDRLVPQTDAEIHYDRHNRLRLHGELGDEIENPGGSSDLMKHQTDQLIVKIPRFTVTANSASFRAITHVITNLLLYSDPVHSKRNEALETFLFTYDFTDVSSATEVVRTLQGRIRQLMQIARQYDLAAGSADDRIHREAMLVHAELTNLGDRLDFIFEAIRLAQEKARNFDDTLASALQLQVLSDLISWNMLGPHSNLVAKLAVRGIRFLWTSRKDSSTDSALTIRDFEALNGMAGATFPEVLVVHPQPATHPMVKKKVFAEARWTVLPPVAQISVIERFELQLHPLKIQIERKIGRELQEYISPKDRKPKAIAAPSKTPPTPPVSGPRRSLDHVHPPLPPRLLLSRNTSAVETKETNGPPTPGGRLRPLHRSVSSHSLRTAPIGPPTPSAVNQAGNPSAATETDEMRVRAKKRTFLFIGLESFTIVLTYKGESLNLGRRGDQGGIKARDLVPNVNDFPLVFPRFEHHNCTWGVDDFIHVVKSELKKNAVGVVFRAFNARISSKYRPEAPHRTLTGLVKAEHARSSFDSAETGGSPKNTTPPRPPMASRARTTSDVSFADKRVLEDGDPLRTSPTSSRPPTLPSSSTSLQSSPSISRKLSTSKARMLDFLRHRHRSSTGDALGNSVSSSSSASRRQSLDTSY